MRKVWCGFTIVEVSLFLAITGLLFMGIAAGVQNSVFQQRYNDSVQSFAEFLRSAYSQVSNVQHSGSGQGRSKYAIYGKLIVFGEQKGLDGDSDAEGAVYSYDVIGDADIRVGDTLASLGTDKSTNKSRVNVFYDGKFAGNVEEYKPKWMARIQGTTNGIDYKGAILIVRNPSSGTIYTYISKDSFRSKIDINSMNKQSDNPLSDIDSDFTLQSKDVNFCVNPDGNQKSDTRRNVRLVANARNASGVEVVTADSNKNEEGGNACK